MKHTIYHIPGVKVGCTIDFKGRISHYPEGTVIEVLEVLKGKTHEEAGDIEWCYAEKFGYRKGTHYADVMKAIEKRSAKNPGIPRKKGDPSHGHTGVKKSAEHVKNMRAGRLKNNTCCIPCTVDGIVIYRSKKDLGHALGRGKKGTRHPNFRELKVA